MWKLALRPSAVWTGAAALLCFELLLDHVPRFFQGDSISYLSTDGRYIPPDRSWLFGFAVNWLLRITHGHLAYLVCQVSLLLLVLVACSTFFGPRTARRDVAYAAFVLAACLDPMLGLYARFYMTDLLACLLFLAFLACLHGALRASWAGFVYWLPAIAALMVAAVFTRVAYALVGVMTVLIAGAGAFRFSRPIAKPILGRLIIVLALPPLAVAALVAANAVVFANRFPGELFVNKLSGVFLMGTFAPALTAADFRASGVDVSDADVAALDLPNYDSRDAQIWSTDNRSAHTLIKHHLGVTEDYTAKVDEICARIVWHAALRDPLSLARVYATTLLFHFEPSQWQRFLGGETGVTRRLPQGFVDWVNRVSSPPISPEIVEISSPMLVAFLWMAPVYPLLLLGGTVGACWRLLAGRDEIGGVLVSAGFLASMITAPLYTVYVIPRYVIAAVFLGYLLWAEILANPRSLPSLSGRRRQRESAPGRGEAAPAVLCSDQRAMQHYDG